MSLTTQRALRVVLYEGEGSQPLASTHRFEAISQLLDRGFSVTRATGSGMPASAARTELLVLGQFTGRQAPAGEDADGTIPLRFKDITGVDPSGMVHLVESIRETTETVRHGDWKPWFPVIDYDRCTNCMQCLSFCLFGVYGVDAEKRIQAQNHDQCKTNCPACSRVCPEAAIIFPKYKAGPINGDEVSATDLNREKMKVDISALLGGDVYSLLRDRSDKARSRFSKERDSDKALKERQKCLTKLVAMGDIPPEVLMSLPSPEEITRKAQEAQARAAAALADRNPAPGNP